MIDNSISKQGCVIVHVLLKTFTFDHERYTKEFHTNSRVLSYDGVCSLVAYFYNITMTLWHALTVLLKKSCFKICIIASHVQIFIKVK